jgi:UDP-glucose 4-epimerase
MRVVVTGSGGTLGRALVGPLLAAGHQPVLMDIAPRPDRTARATDQVAVETVVGDVRSFDDVRRAMQGADLVVHTAAIHGIHLSSHTPREFYDLNVTGTFNVWEAAVSESVKGLVFSSTMGVYGESRRPRAESDVVAVNEDLPLLPGDVYGLSKVVGEELCRWHWRADHIPSVALRYGMFVPEPFFRYGIRLLYGGVHEQDVAAAVMAALRALERREIEFEAFNVESALPFTDADAADLRRDPLVAIDRHFPGAADLLRSRGVEQLKPITERFVVDRAEALLGWKPLNNFAEWLEELDRQPHERAESNPPWP